MCNTIPEDENGVQQDINGPEKVPDIGLMLVEINYHKSLAAAFKNTTENLQKQNEYLQTEIKKLRDGIKYIAKDMAVLETDCAHEICDMYVMKAKELMGWTE